MREKSISEVKRVTRVIEIFHDDYTGTFTLQDRTETHNIANKTLNEQCEPILNFDTLEDADAEMNNRLRTKPAIKKYVRRTAASNDLFTKGDDYLVIGYDGKDGYILIDNFINETIDYKSRFTDSR